ncbi:hypothetical protein P153DRAFT_370922 [Dothidotthia symphoricarpi CBS 119687]|uniref:Amino acid transporter transmembrane domain-containing protein n=1 Tax=Dothidotthia symphoricarpi CBS 119687 TaxID=1392245 RepID=A0A6A5ZZ02_9PLEO|nr:uncharacterized protein P153DRAFT_370922 [Dothidotthia symphoricarpi CBS 119687]KAF2124516.1 hypothetical protein P153DRAFT_370922 [Dothidotthia symphoricarpi CBS 119687]
MSSPPSSEIKKGYAPGHVDAESQHVAEDAVFGEVVEGGPDYRAVGWKGTVALMLKTQIGLGVLSIPAVFDVLGLIPGILCLFIIGIITCWSNYVVGVFKLRHPEVYGIEDVGSMLFGRVGREILGGAFALWWVCVAGSGMLGISIALNSLSEHGTCTAVFVAVAAIIGFALSSIPTLGKITWVAWIGLVGILSAILTVTIAVGLQDRPPAAPLTDGPWKSDFKLFGNPTFAEAAAALTSLVFAYAGTPAFFNIVSEMRDPRMYTRAVMIQQSISTCFYGVVGIVVYYYCGSYVASPALGSAGAMMKKVCYGLALPGLIASTMLVTHINAKYFFIRTLRGSRHLNHNTPTHWIVWFSYTAGVSLAAYVIASAVPVFGGLVSLVGALFGTLMCFQPMGCMWLYDNWSAGKATKSPKWIAMVVWCVFVIASGTFLMIAGTYGSLVEIIASYSVSGGSKAWTCADNSNST